MAHNKHRRCQDLSDAEIIRASLIEVDHFACLFERYEDKMLRYILRISKCTREEAEDILQEAFIKVYKNIHSFNPKLPFSSWLYRIVHNETISFWRKNKTRKPFNLPTDQIEELTPFLFNEGEDETRREEIMKLKKSLDRLKKEYREVLILKYYEELSYEEISDVLMIPEGTVATRLNRAKKKIIEYSKDQKKENNN